MGETILQGSRDRIELLSPQDIRSLRVPWWSLFAPADLVLHLQQYPCTSFRIKGENQYVVGGQWRGRPEVGLVLELVGSKDRGQLVDKLVDSYREQGCVAVVMSSDEANRSAKWFLQHGWQAIDEIVVYTRKTCRIDGLPIVKVIIEGFRRDDIDELLALERSAFPFLWWSGKEDFLRYTGSSEVETFVLRVEGQMAGYVSFTLRGRFGYLDRLAIRGDFQGQGYGAQLLTFALDWLDSAEARTVSLNTQTTNKRAQNLYSKFGFVRTSNIERIYGLWLGEQGAK